MSCKHVLAVKKESSGMSWMTCCGFCVEQKKLYKYVSTIPASGIYSSIHLLVNIPMYLNLTKRMLVAVRELIELRN